MYKLYCYGDLGGDWDNYYEIERDTLQEIYKWICEQSWYWDIIDNSFNRTNFKVIRMTEFKETEIMTKDNPLIQEIMDNSLKNLQELKLKEDEKQAKLLRDNELKLLEELKKKYEMV